jgi:hypothetical protein
MPPVTMSHDEFNQNATMTDGEGGAPLSRRNTGRSTGNSVPGSPINKYVALLQFGFELY